MYARSPSRPKPQTAKLAKFDAPTAGWISNRALSDPRSIEGPGAAILDNFFPTSSKVTLRRGAARHSEPSSSPVASLFSYNNGTNERLYAATATDVYDISTIAPSSVLSGKTSGDWSIVQFATTGGVFLIGVNGADAGFIFDGASFSALSITFSGGSLTTADMSYVWVYKNRLWFAQKNSMTAWYMPVDAIAGTPVALPLGGVFGMGGALLFGQTWSLDSGADGGLSEQCIFVSTEGEVAVYQGTNPAVAAEWQRVGVYRIGTPLGKKAFLRGGGDLAIATSVGLVPLSKAISLDVSSLNVATISYKIADAWAEAVEKRGLAGWSVQLWPQQKMALISTPNLIDASSPVVFVSNAETGAWCRFTGWDVLCMEVFQGKLYFGSPDGVVYVANEGGVDDAMPYTGIVLPLFNDFGSPASLKTPKIARAIVRAFSPISTYISAQVDFEARLPMTPDASGASTDNLWGAGVWGTSVWGAITPTVVNQEWQSVSGAGYSLSLAGQITSGSAAPLDAEIIRMEFTYTEANIVS